MRLNEILEARRNPAMNVKKDVYTQITEIVKKNGGQIDDYFIHNSSVNRVGFYGGTKSDPNAPAWAKDSKPLTAPVVSDKPFKGQFLGYTSPERGGVGPKNSERKYGVWFTPLKYCIENFQKGLPLPFSNKYTFLVKIKPNGWLQPVDTLSRIKTNLVGIKPPAGKKIVGQYSSSSHIAVFFEAAYDVVGSWSKQEIDSSLNKSHMAYKKTLR